MRPGSLVRRLIGLAAVYILAALILTGSALNAFFQQTALRQLDRTLAEMIDPLLAGTNVAPDGTVLAPRLPDQRTERVYSGRYWQIAALDPDGRLRPLRTSRSLFDAELARPGDLARRVQASPGRVVYYNTRG